MRWPEPADTKQREAQILRPTKGGAMRIRIALMTAMSVAFIMSIMMSFSTYAGVAEATIASHNTTTHQTHKGHLTAARRTVSALGALGSSSQPATHQSGNVFPSAVLSAQLPGRTAFAAAALPSFTPPPPPPPPPAPITDATSTNTADWRCIRIRESGDNYNNPNMPSGAYGILLSTWESFGYSGWPYQAAPATQDGLALKLYHEFGWQPWSSRFACGL
jgi:hypothetical protein